MSDDKTEHDQLRWCLHRVAELEAAREADRRRIETLEIERDTERATVERADQVHRRTIASWAADRQRMERLATALRYVACPTMGRPGDIGPDEAERWVRDGNGTSEYVRAALCTCIGIANRALQGSSMATTRESSREIAPVDVGRLAEAARAVIDGIWWTRTPLDGGTYAAVDKHALDALRSVLAAGHTTPDEGAWPEISRLVVAARAVLASLLEYNQYAPADDHEPTAMAYVTWGPLDALNAALSELELDESG